MKAIFSDEVAQELGYQEYWPELKDWVIATIACLAAGVLFVGLLCLILIATGNWDKQFQVRPCTDYADVSISNMPARCIQSFLPPLK